MRNQVNYSYLDTLSQRYGPYSGQQMMHWYRQNMLASSLCIRIEAVHRESSTCVIQLQHLVDRLGRNEPFPNEIKDNQIRGFLTSPLNNESKPVVKLKCSLETKKELMNEPPSQKQTIGGLSTSENYELASGDLESSAEVQLTASTSIESGNEVISLENLTTLTKEATVLENKTDHNNNFKVVTRLGSESTPTKKQPSSVTFDFRSGTTQINNINEKGTASDATGDTLGVTTTTSSTDSQQKQKEVVIEGAAGDTLSTTTIIFSADGQQNQNEVDIEGAAGDTLVTTTIASSTDDQQKQTEVDVEGASDDIICATTIASSTDGQQEQTVVDIDGATGDIPGTTTIASCTDGQEKQNEGDDEVVEIVQKNTVPTSTEPRLSYPLLRKPLMFHIVPEDKAHLKLFHLQSAVINLPKFYYDYCNDVPVPEKPYCELCEIQLVKTIDIFEHLVCSGHTKKLLKEGFTYQDIHFWISCIDALCLRGGQTIKNVMSCPETIETTANGSATVPLIDVQHKVQLNRVFEVNQAKELWNKAKRIISFWGKEEEKDFNTSYHTLNKKTCMVCSSEFSTPYKLMQHVFTRSHIKKFHEYFGPDEVRYWWNKIEETMTNVKRLKTSAERVCETGTQTEEQPKVLEPTPSASDTTSAESEELPSTPLLKFPCDESRSLLCTHEQFNENLVNLKLRLEEYTNDNDREEWLAESEMQCEVCSKLANQPLVLKTNLSAVEHITSESHSFIMKYIGCLPSDFEFWSNQLIEKKEVLKRKKNKFVSDVLYKSAVENNDIRENLEDFQEIMNVVRKARGSVDATEFDRLFPDILKYGKMCEFCGSTSFGSPSDVLMHVTSLHHLVKMKGLPEKPVWMKWIECMSMAKRNFERSDSCTDEKRAKVD